MGLMDFLLKLILIQKNAKSDPHTMLKLDLLHPILKQAMKIRNALM